MSETAVSGFSYPEDVLWDSEERQRDPPARPAQTRRARACATCGVWVILAVIHVLVTERLLSGASAGSGPWLVFLAATALLGSSAATTILGPVVSTEYWYALCATTVGLALVLGILLALYWPLEISLAKQADNMRPRFLYVES